MDTQDGKPVSFSAINDHLYVVMPSDMNTGNTLYGGTIPYVGDKLAAAVAKHHSGKASVTLGFDRMRFWAPTRLGEVLRFKIAVNRVWGSSLEIGMKIYAEDFLQDERRHVLSTYVTFVTEDKLPIRPVIPETDDEQRRYAEADTRRAKRLLEEEEYKRKKGA